MAAHRVSRKVARDALATAVLQLLAKVRGLILLPVLVRVGSEALYGVWTMLGGLVALLIPVVNLNAHQGLLRFAAPLDAIGARRLFRQVVGFSSLTATALAAIGAAVALRFAGSFPTDVTTNVIVFTALQVPLWVLVRVNSSFLRARGRVVGAQLSELGAQLLVTIAACAGFLLGFGLAAVQLATGVLLLALIIAVVVVIATSTESLDRVGAAEHPTLTAVLLFSLPFIPGAVSDWALFIADRYILAFFYDETVVGIYAGCYAVSQLLQMVSYPVEYAVTPVLPRLWDGGERDEAVTLLTTCVHLALAVLAPMSTIVILAGPLALTLLGSDAMAAESSRLLPLLCWGITVFACARMMSLIALVEHRGRAVMGRIAATAILNVVLNIALVPPLGAVGSAIATLASYVVYAVLIVQLTRPIAPALVALGRPMRICAAALLPATIVLLPLDSVLARLAACAAYAIAYLALAHVLRAFTFDDWRLIARTLRRAPSVPRTSSE